MEPINIFLAEEFDEDCNLFKDAVSGIFSEYKIHRVKDGHECLYALKHFYQPDLIFLDLNMPMKSGLDCLKSIRLMPELTDIPVIIYSSSFNLKDIDAAYRNGAAYFFVKSSSLSCLTDMLYRLFFLLKQPKNQPVLKTDFVIRQMTHGRTG